MGEGSARRQLAVVGGRGGGTRGRLEGAEGGRRAAADVNAMDRTLESARAGAGGKIRRCNGRYSTGKSCPKMFSLSQSTRATCLGRRYATSTRGNSFPAAFRRSSSPPRPTAIAASEIIRNPVAPRAWTDTALRMSVPGFQAPTALRVWPHSDRPRLRRLRTVVVAATSPPSKPASAAPPQTRPVLRPSAAPAWDSGALCSPVVRPYQTEDGVSYAMWYSARPQNWPRAASTPPGTLSGLVGLALSRDGLSFSRVPGPLEGAVLRDNSEDWWAFDTRAVDVGDVLLGSSGRVRADAGVYFMYYSGVNAHAAEFPLPDGQTRMVPGMRRCIGVALSKDGEHFTRVEGDYPSGAALEPGQPGEFDALFVASPVVLRPTRPRTKDHTFIMHYFSYDTSSRRFVVGRAVSRDGLLFRRDGDAPALTAGDEPFAARGVSRCSVVERVAGSVKRFVMFVECIDEEGMHRIALCESDDCENWSPLTLVLRPGEGEAAWDRDGVSHPCAVAMEDGSLRLYYVGKAADHDVDAGRGTCIGVAESDGTDWAVLRRVSMSEVPYA